ncbi:MAG: hypothetical protein J6Y78_11400 [Paludibacteraceae bacterium]|nr:hypothetical protein [Paludibacteraceae bacterium]
MSKENVREYLKFMKERMNTSLYLYEMYDVFDKLKELESKLSIREINDIKFLSDYDLCSKYNLEPKDITSKYVGYVLDKDDEVVEEKKGSITFVTRRKVLGKNMKTDIIGIRNDIINEIVKRAEMLKELDEEKFEEMKL